MDKHGNICLDILKEKWSALYEVRTILLSIQSLLGEPNNDSPLNTHAAALWPDQVRRRLFPVFFLKKFVHVLWHFYALDIEWLLLSSQDLFSLQCTYTVEACACV